MIHQESTAPSPGLVLRTSGRLGVLGRQAPWCSGSPDVLRPHRFSNRAGAAARHRVRSSASISSATTRSLILRCIDSATSSSNA
jgi:hypothetical protein